MKLQLVTGLLVLLMYTSEGARKFRAAKIARRLKSKPVSFTRQQLASELGLKNKDALVFNRQTKTALGQVKEQLKQTYAGLPVVGGEITADYNSAEGYTGIVAGDVYTGLEEDVPYPDECVQQDDVVAAVAFAAEGVSPSDVAKLQVTREIIVRDGKGYLAYEVNFQVRTETVTRPCYFIDACELTVIFHFNNIQNRAMRARGNGNGKGKKTTTTTTTTTTPTTTTTTTTSAPSSSCPNPTSGEGGNLKVGRTYYGTDVCLDTTVSGSTCILQNSNVRVIDMQQTRIKSGRSAVAFTCSQGYDDEINDGYSAVLDAMYFGTMSVQMFTDWYDVTPLDDIVTMYVHYDRRYENAFWDGVSLTFGDGYTTLYPLVSMDVVAHELAHGVTEKNSFLVYAEESGGINEAFSDITGLTADEYINASLRWDLGWEIFKADRALRYFDDPTRDGRSIKHVNQYYTGLDVHYSSGIFNHAFYQMVAVRSMPIRQAFHSFLNANQFYWSRFTDFEFGACGVLESAYDLGYDFFAVMRSFEVVGITFEDCPITSFITIISADATLNDLTVSASKNPVFMLDPPQGSTQVTVTASEPVNIDIYDDLESGSSLMSATGQMTYQLPSSLSSLYVRLSAASEVDINVSSVQVTFQ